MRKVIIAPAATNDLSNARGWLKQPGAGIKAASKLQAITNSIKDLKKTPCRWQTGSHPGTREILVHGYRIIYEVNPDTGDNSTAGNVEVLRVFGPGQIPNRI